MLKKPKTLLLIILCIGIIGLSCLYILGTILTNPHQSNFDLKPDDFGITNVEDIIFSSTTGKLLSGTFIKGQKEKGGILLMHSVRSDRREMVDRATMLNTAGYSVLLFDFQAHGKSSGKHITFGYLESQDTNAAFKLLKNKINGKPVGIIGVSLGGASALLSSIKNQANAIVLEMVYPTLKEAVKNRIEIHLKILGKHLSPLLLWQIKPRLGFSPEELSPIDELKQTTSPVFIIAGTKDKHTSIDQSNRMFEQASEPKKIWRVKGAAHQNIYEYAPEKYRDQVLTFFHDYMHN